jgi:hypothetical protein
VRIFPLLFLANITACSTSANDGAGGSSSVSSSHASSTMTGVTTGAAGCVEGPIIADNPVCEACQNLNCCVTAANCAANPECLAVEACVEETHSPSACYADHPDGTWDWSGVETCRKNHCASECALDPGACGNIIPSPASCTAEVNMKCCDSTSACGNDDACLALVYQCLDANACSTQKCVDDCAALYPEGKPEFDAMVACWSTVACL